MQITFSIVTLLIFLLLWGIYSRLVEIHEELFELRHPQMKNDGPFAEYLGKADDDA